MDGAGHATGRHLAGLLNEPVQRTRNTHNIAMPSGIITVLAAVLLMMFETSMVRKAIIPR